MGLMGITPQQFRQMQERLVSPRRKAPPVFERAAPASTNAHQVILGLDPSLRGTGYGVIRWPNRTRRPWPTARFPARRAGNTRAAWSRSPRPCAR